MRRRGDVLIYGPSKRHTAVNPTGARFAFGAIEVGQLETVADELGLDPSWPAEDEMRVVRGPRAHALRRVIPALVYPSSPAIRSLPQELFGTVVEELAGTTTSGACRRIDDGELILACLDYAEQVQRVPSVDELCSATFVCRRKLWDAFHERYGMSPGRFFRNWGLSRAHDRLRASDPAAPSVARVATDLGFTHTGRFASRYRSVFGELPSQTLRSSV